MKITIKKDKLAEALAAVKEVVAKDPLSVFNRIRLDSAGEYVTLAASNGDVDVSFRTLGRSNAAGVETLQGSMLLKFAGVLPDGDVTITAEKSRASIECGSGMHFKLSAVSSLPAMVPPKEKSAKIYLPAMAAGEMLRKVSWAASKNETRKILCGVNVKLHNRILEMTAANGAQLANVTYELDEEACDNAASFEFTLPNNAVKIIKDRLVGANGELTIFADNQKAMFVHDNWCVTAKVLAGAYPNWRQVVPKDLPHTATIKRRPFIESLMAAALAADEKHAVKLTLQNGKIVFEAKGELSDAKIVIDECTVPTGGSTVVMFDGSIIADALGVVDSEEFKLEFGDNRCAVVIRSSVQWLAVVMPLSID